jgi:hypothetical protein
MSTVMSLPPELLEHSFSYLLDDYWFYEQDSLGACSFVCRAWRHIAQSLLFRKSSLHLHRFPWTDFNQIKSLGAIVPLFHRLDIQRSSVSNTPESSESGMASDADNRLLFEPIPRRNFKFEEAFVVHWDRVVTMLAHITFVQLSDVSFNSLVALRHVLSGLPALERLGMGTVRVYRDDLPIWTGLRLRSLTHYIGVETAIIHALLTWVATADSPRLEELHSELCEPMCGALRDVLVACTQSLRVLEVHTDSYCKRTLMRARSIQPFFRPQLSALAVAAHHVPPPGADHQRGLHGPPQHNRPGHSLTSESPSNYLQGFGDFPRRYRAPPGCA